MAFCSKCSTPIEENTKFCPQCGASAHPKTANAPDTTALYDSADIEKNKLMAALAYVLFLIPLLVAKDSPFAKYHTNQGLILFIAGIICSMLLIIPIIGWILAPIISIAITVLAVMGIINALGGKTKDLPIIGKYRILK